ncbi:PLP-dependent transferase [Thozetella sp. PMI_491]|nr:PLP-dependent transferase [Thozetella sp. PMI_491]
MSRFSSIPRIEPDLAFALVEEFAADTDEHKVDLCPGFYRDEAARPWVLPSVAEAEKRLFADPDRNHEHLPLTGHPKLISGSQKLVFGLESDLSRITSLQTVSGTGANHLGARLLADRLRPKVVWISNLSWINHSEIWKTIDSSIEVRSYPYFNREGLSLDFEGMLNCLRRDAKAGDVVIVHACAHNPTGIDLTRDQWKAVADLFESKEVFTFFDMAYQGFASGDLDADAWAVRHFYGRNTLEFAVAQSFSKNFGIYGQRVGALHIATADAAVATNVQQALVQLSRAEVTSCPAYGANIVAEILGDPSLYEQWIRDLGAMSGRMKRMRKMLHEGLTKARVRGSWDHLISNIGMFSMTGLTRHEVAELKAKHHIYLLPSGRISVTGLTDQNVETVTTAFREVLGTM